MVPKRSSGSIISRTIETSDKAKGRRGWVRVLDGNVLVRLIKEREAEFGRRFLKTPN